MFRFGQLFPPLCSGCGGDRPSPCRTCVGEMAPPPDLPVPAPLASLSALVRYDAVSSGFVTAVKYRNDRSSLGTFADGLVLIYPDAGVTEAATLTWAPTTAERRRSRGFDQARLMARQIGRGVGVRPRKLLHRVPGPQQTGRSLQDRLSGPRFECIRRGSGPVIVVDDVCTTGATLGAAATVLLAAGFSEVHGLVLARTPVRRGSGAAGF